MHRMPERARQAERKGVRSAESCGKHTSSRQCRYLPSVRGEYVVESGLQKYCPSCAAEAVRQVILPQKRERAAQHRDEFAARKKELKVDSAICAYCGKPYTSTSPTVTCSPECAREYARIVQGMVDYKRGRRKSPPSHERYISGLPQSDLTGVSYHRNSNKWQVVHNGKYIGLFLSQEEAEATKRRLEGQDYADKSNR